MIFNVGDHIQQIILGTKTQTRRATGYADLPRYKIGNTYAVQPGRGKKGIPCGRIKIIDIKKEMRGIRFDELISHEDAEAEGGYHPVGFELLFKKMYPNWVARFAYTFEFVVREEV